MDRCILKEIIKEALELLQTALILVAKQIFLGSFHSLRKFPELNRLFNRTRYV